MCTAHLLNVSQHALGGGMSAPRGVCPGVSTSGPGGGCLPLVPRGVSASSSGGGACL